MEFSYVVQGDILVITLQGEHLDALIASSFKEGILDLIRKMEVTKVVFDFNNLQFIDSSGLGAFLAIQRMLNKQGGILKLANLNKSIQTMFEIISMHRILDIFPTADDAVKSF